MKPEKRGSDFSKGFFGLLWLALICAGGPQFCVGQSPLTTNPTSPIIVDPNNHRYFNYGGRTVALVGMSGEYTPHISELKNVVGQTVTFNPQQNPPPGSPNGAPAISYCTHDLNPNNVLKAHRCINIVSNNGMDKMRLWISLDSSPGTDLTPQKLPYLDEQPFAYNGSGWNLSSLDANFFANLLDIVSWAQSHGVIVEVTIFAPASGHTGPWVGVFSNNNYFTQADCLNPPAGFLDCNMQDQTARAEQLSVVDRVVDTLNSVGTQNAPQYNYYYELANEPDLNNSLGGAQTIAWHTFMANHIWNREATAPRVHHLIAVNLSYGCPGVSPPCDIDALIVNDPGIHIDIVNGHYVSENNANQYGAMALLRQYNIYNRQGQQGLANNRIWGFNEGLLSGFRFPGAPACADVPIPGWPSNSGCPAYPATPDGVRAQAWEFLLNGGGSYDNFSYDWGNLRATSSPSPAPNDPDTDLTIPIELGGLSGFINTQLPSGLMGMFRLMNYATTTWIADAPAYGSADIGGASNVYWAAIQNNTNTYMYYEHHSKLVSLGGGLNNTGYAAVPSQDGTGMYHRQLTVQNLTPCASGTTTFTPVWYQPQNFAIGSYTGGVSNPPFSASPSTLTAPAFRYDILLVIKRTCT